MHVGVDAELGCTGIDIVGSGVEFVVVVALKCRRSAMFLFC